MVTAHLSVHYYYHRLLKDDGALLSSCAWTSFTLSVLIMMTVVVSLSAFFKFNAQLSFSSAIAQNSFRDRLYLSFIVLILANFTLTHSRVWEALEVWKGDLRQVFDYPKVCLCKIY